MHSSSTLPFIHQSCMSWGAPVWTAWYFCFGGLTVVDSFMGVDGPWSGWLPSPAYYRGCWQLINLAGSWGGRLLNPGGSWT